MITEKRIIVNGDTYTVRGLTAKEMIDMRLKKYHSQSTFLYFFCAACIKNIEYIFDQNGNRLKYGEDITFDEVFPLSSESLETLAKIYEEAIALSIVSREEQNLVEGYLFFSSYVAEKPEVEKSWNCKRCITDGLLKRRNCKRFDEETIKKILTENYVPPGIDIEEGDRKQIKENKEEEDREEKERKMREFLSERSFKRKAKALTFHREKKEVDEPLAESPKFVLTSPIHKWESCPLSIFGYNELMIDMDTCFRAIRNETYSLDGEEGMLNQNSRFLDLVHYIKSYQSDIQHKMQEHHRKESEKKSPKGRGRKRGK